MVCTSRLEYFEDGTVNIESWLEKVAERRPPEHIALIRDACRLTQLTDQSTETGQSCLNQGLAVADILLTLELDHEAVAATIVYNSVRYADLHVDNVGEHLGERIAQLVQRIEQMEQVHLLTQQGTLSDKDRLRRMFLAMVDDVRVVVIKLAERTCLLRKAQHLPPEHQRQLAP